MYETFYQLTKRPFPTGPDTTDIYWSDGHAEAFAALRYGILGRAPIVMLTGEIGVGKTTLIRLLLRDLAETLTPASVAGLADGRGDLLDWVMMSLGEPRGSGSYAERLARFRTLAARRRAEGRRVVVLVDEAQSLRPRMLEELWLLAHADPGGGELLQLLIAGQPQLRQRLARPRLAHLGQRIAADAHLGRLSAPETAAYIHSRTAAAGAGRRIFGPVACGLVHEATGGVPRLINILCEHALVYGYADARHQIGEDLLRGFFEDARARGTYTQFSPPSRPLTLVPDARAAGVSGGHGAGLPAEG